MSVSLIGFMFSATPTFSSQPILSAPNLLTPATGSITSVTPQFSWASVKNAQTYRIQVATNNDLSFVSPVVNATTQSTTYTQSTPLGGGTTYRFRVRSENKSSVSAWSSVWTLTTVVTPSPTPSAIPTPTSVPISPTPTPDMTPPSAPGNLTASAVSTSQINLTWSASTDNVGVVGYDVYRNGVFLTTAIATSYSDFNLTPATTYSYYVKARDDAGNNSSQSNSVSAVTLTPTDTTKPTVTITSPSNGATIQNTITVTGTANDNNSLAKVELEVDSNGFVQATGTTNWSYALNSALYINGAHTLTVRATDTSGNQQIATISININNSPALLSNCSDGSPVLQQTTSPEGMRIAICTTVGGWTTSSIYNLLQPSALDLPIIGPNLTIQVQTGNPSTEGSSSSCCDASGHYYGYGAVIVVNPNSNSTFTTAPDALMAHEYGHAWTYYWLYMNSANHGSWVAYDNFRWANADGTQVLAQNPSLNTSYNWMDYEMAADDYRRLFGTSLAQSQLFFINSSVPDSKVVTGLSNFFLNTWRKP